MDLTVIDETGARTEQVSVPDTVATGRITARLVQMMGLPRTEADGRQILYVFQHESTGRQIGKEETLAQAKVNEHDVLRLVALRPAPAAPPAPTALSPEPPPPPQQPPPGLWRSPPSMALALAALVLAGAGVAVALILSHGGSRNESVASLAHNVVGGAPSSSESQTSVSKAEQATGETVTTESTETTEGAESTDGKFPDVSAEQMATEVQQMLRSWHEDVVQGDYRAAWELLSQRKRDQAEAEPGGYAAWAKNQATLGPYLDPSGIQVSVQDTDQSSGVAQVDVTGMTWDKPGASCREWSGITWVKFEDGEWRYDPGYSTTPQRKHEWSSKYSELLGGSC
jgi:hypothetical protein